MLILGVFKRVLKAMKAFAQKKYQDHIPCSFASELVCLDYRFSEAILVFRGKNAAFKFVEAILKEYE